MTFKCFAFRDSAMATRYVNLEKFNTIKISGSSHGEDLRRVVISYDDSRETADPVHYTEADKIENFLRLYMEGPK